MMLVPCPGRAFLLGLRVPSGYLVVVWLFGCVVGGWGAPVGARAPRMN